MERMRKPYQGVWNIILFNWHFYALSISLLILLSILSSYLNESLQLVIKIVLFLVFGTILISLLASYYIYDYSDLYKFKWLNTFETRRKCKIVNINAGFDETSVLLKNKFRAAELIVFDFYNPLKHTEISIKRARKAYPAFPNTIMVNTSLLPLKDHSIDIVFVILSAHEIRNAEERIIFFRELKRLLNSQGQIIVTEHIRGIANFMVYNIGFLHFYSKASWLNTFSSAGLRVEKEIKITPFITTFILDKHGATA